MRSKKWYRSKTIMGLSGPLIALGLAFLTSPELRQVVDGLPDDWQFVALIIIGGAVGALRVVTDKAVEW